MKKILLSIYSSPERYPPTLNAIEELSKKGYAVTVLYRANVEPSWGFPENVKREPDGKLIAVMEQMSLGRFSSIFLNIKYVIKSIQLSWSVKPDIYLVYDEKALALFSWVFFLIPKGKLWFHSHDVNEHPNRGIKKYLELLRERTLKKASLVTLPAIERLSYIPVGPATQVQLLPNFPSIAFYSRYKKTEQNDCEISLLYQGAISDGHGLLEIVSILGQPVNGKKLKLHLAGVDRSGYVKELQEKASKLGVESQVVYHGLLPYIELPKLTVNCDIGIAINKPKGIIYQTGGTASNKIYEYAACGLPILYYDNEHYTKYLGKHEWALGTNLSPDNILDCIQAIDNDYSRYSEAARNSFLEVYNYENAFKPVGLLLDGLLNKNRKNQV